jgi:hypothetical protein
MKVMARPMNPSETRNRHSKLATWWRHWRNRDVISGPSCCCHSDAIEHLARLGEAESREPHVHAGKWPADSIRWSVEDLSIERLSATDRV